MQAFLIGIAGPSGAGKSTFCRRLEQNHTNVGRLKLDDFFCDLDEVSLHNGYKNWDDPASINWNGLILAARTLKFGSHATVPHYDRQLNRCVGEKCILPKEIIIIDGFLTLHHPELRTLLEMSFFFSLPEHLQITRRKERQPWVEEGYLHEVMIPNARKYVMPSSAFATHVINAEHEPDAIYHEILNLISDYNPMARLKSCSSR
jgi:uridine kinase